MAYSLIVLSLFALDSTIKSYIEKNMEIGETHPILGGKILLKRSHNKGALLNIGESHPTFVVYLSVACTILVTGGLLVAFGREEKKMLKTGLALIIGGAYSNTYDRCRRSYVVDYFSFAPMTKKVGHPLLTKWSKRCSTIVFNIADFGIFAGAALIVVAELFGKK